MERNRYLSHLTKAFGAGLKNRDNDHFLKETKTARPPNWLSNVIAVDLIRLRTISQ